jgi:predicted deacylase
MLRSLGSAPAAGRLLLRLAGLCLPLAAPAAGLSAQAPPLRVIEIRGASAGPTVAFVAGIHGGKASASRALERFARRLEQRKDRMRGRVRIVPVANEAGRAAGLAQLAPDSLNLNRVFPGKWDGKPTERLAARIMSEVVAGADYLVDMHGSDGEEAVGRFAYAARPGVRPSVDSAALELARAWGTPLVVWDTDGPRTLATSSYLQTAAHLSRVPAITVFEAGAERESPAAIEAFLAGAERLLGALDVITLEREPMPPPVVRPARDVVAAPAAGAWSAAEGMRPGRSVARDELLGSFADTSSGMVTELRASNPGIVLHLRQAKAGTVAARVPLVIIAVDDTKVNPGSDR